MELLEVVIVSPNKLVVSFRASEREHSSCSDMFGPFHPAKSLVFYWRAFYCLRSFVMQIINILVVHLDKEGIGRFHLCHTFKVHDSCTCLEVYLFNYML